MYLPITLMFANGKVEMVVLEIPILAVDDFIGALNNKHFGKNGLIGQQYFIEKIHCTYLAK